MNDTITLEQLRRLPMGEVAALDAGSLAQLQAQASSAVEQAKLTKEFLDGVLNRRYGDRAALLRHQQGKDFGMIRFDDEDITVSADLPKRTPIWDQKQLAEIVQNILNAGEDPAEYIDTTLKVSENRFKAWPKETRRIFEPARTVKAGKPVFKLIPKKSEAAR